MLDFTRKVFRGVQSLCAAFGIELNYVGRVRANIPDKDLYRPHFSPWNAQSWRERLEVHDLTSLVTADRKYVLWTLLEQAVRAIEGDVIECGVYRGGTAHMFCRLLRSLCSEKKLHLFDTFGGMPDTNEAHDLHRAGDFANTSLGAVQAYLANAHATQFYPGFIPETFVGAEDLRFCFAHIDLDIYDAIKAATAFVYDRMPRGGFIVYDDYGLASCPGARKAVDEFFADKIERPLVLKTGQCIINKA